MKKTLLIFFFTIQVFSQIQVGVKSYDVKPSIEKVSETDAEYPGGINVFRSFFVTNFDFPSDLTVPLRMVITFTVCDDGSLCNFEVDSPNQKTKEEAIRIMKLSKNWLPATRDGKAIDSKFRFPLTLQIE